MSRKTIHANIVPVALVATTMDVWVKKRDLIYYIPTTAGYSIFTDRYIESNLANQITTFALDHDAFIMSKDDNFNT